MMAARSGGQVELYVDLMTAGMVAVKHLPRSRLRDSPQAYQEAWPGGGAKHPRWPAVAHHAPNGTSSKHVQKQIQQHGWSLILAGEVENPWKEIEIMTPG